MKRVTLILFVLFTLQGLFAQRTISSLEEFIELQDASNQNIKMTPGVYHISSSTKTFFDGGDWIVRTRGEWPGLLDFTGNNNTFDLTGVTFTFDSTIIDEMPNLAHGNLVRLGGANNTWIGFNLQELPGDDGTYGVFIHVSGGLLLKITGTGHHFENLTVKARYSSPYGFGSIYGKTGSSSGMLPNFRLGKKNGLVLNALTNSTFKNVLVDHSAFGHTLFFDGPINNVLVENATVIAESRSTNDIRTNGINGVDRNGVPFGLNYNGTILTGAQDNATFFDYFDTDNLDQCQNMDGGNQKPTIRNGYQFSLSEDAFRGYNQGEIKNLTIRNATVVGARSGIALGIAGEGLIVENMTVKGIAGHGVPACDDAWNSDNGGEGDASAFDIPSYAVVKNAQADSAYSTVLELNGDRKEITADIEILDPDNGYLRPSGSTALALISGSDHEIRLWKRDGQALDEDLVIKVGNNNTSGLLLCNMTKQSVTLSNNVTNSTIYSIGNVVDSSNGSNTIINVSSLSQEPCECASIGTEETTSTTLCGDGPSFIPDPNKTYYIDAPYHNLRLAATGESEYAYTTSTSTISADVEWKFVAKGNGSWHIQRAAGGTLPRFRTDNNISDGTAADMQGTAWSGTYTYFDFEQGAIAGTYFITLPDGPTGRVRLQIDNSGGVQMVENTRDGTWESFTITEVEGSGSCEWVTIANEREVMNFSGTKTIRYGANGTYVTKVVTGTTTCGNAFFGDPLPGVGKVCQECVGSTVASIKIEAEDYDGMYEIQTEETADIDGGDNVGWINNGDWLRFDAINLSGLSNMDARVATKTAGGTLEVRIGSETGTLIGSIEVTNTGDYQNWETKNTNISNANGIQDVYLVFKGGSGYLFNVNWIEFNNSSTANKDVFVFAEISDVLIYPNPVASTTTIANVAGSILNVYDMNGSVVFTTIISSESEVIDLNNLAAGVYYTEVIGERESSIVKIVKK